VDRGERTVERSEIGGRESTSDGIRDFRDLDVWKLARSLAADIYRVTGAFPKQELFGIASQMQRAAVSLIANIAEGAGRVGAAEYEHHISIALGSAAELRALLIVSMDIGYLSEAKAQEFFARVDRLEMMLHGLRKSLSARR
jgi:four helix bundle protein